MDLLLRAMKISEQENANTLFKIIMFSDGSGNVTEVFSQSFIGEFDHFTQIPYGIIVKVREWGEV